jgi:parvulin-like peptidyl-prolyl isomerase
VTTRLERLAAAPLFHCLLLGGAFAWLLALVAPAVLTPNPAELADAVRMWRESAGRAPGPVELAGLVDEFVNDEVLYREALSRHFDELPVVKDRLIKLATFLELLPASASAEERLRAALAMGLDRSDLLVRRYMVGAARERLASELEGAAPERSEVEAYYRANTELFTLPAAMRLRHVYVGGQGAGARARADTLVRDLRKSGLDVAAAIRLGDVFYGGHELPLLDAAGIGGRFGVEFAEAVVALEPGVWSDSIRSAYGYHLVWKDEQLPARRLPIEAVESKIAVELSRQHDEAALSEAIAALRSRYRVVVPDDAH